MTNKAAYSGTHGNLPLPQLTMNAKSLALTMSSGVGSCPIPTGVSRVGVYPTAAATFRIGLVAPEAQGAATGNAALTDLKLGVAVPAAAWTWFDIPAGVSTIYFKAGSAEVTQVAFV
jgi:hypothetical protein